MPSAQPNLKVSQTSLHVEKVAYIEALNTIVLVFLLLQLRDPSLWVEQGLIAGKLVEAKSGKRFNVEGQSVTVKFVSKKV